MTAVQRQYAAGQIWSIFDNEENGPSNPLGQFDCNTLRPGKVYELSIVELHDFVSSLHAIGGKSFNFLYERGSSCLKTFNFSPTNFRLAEEMK